MELIRLDNLVKVLEEYAQEVRNLYQDKLIQENRIATGELLNSVEYRVEQKGVEYDVIITLADYWRFIETDTEPHFPPPDALLKWIQVKPVLPRPDANGKIPTPQQLAFLIGRKIAEEGTKGNYPLYNSVEEINKKYKNKAVVAFQADMQGYLTKILVEPFK